MLRSSLRPGRIRRVDHVYGSISRPDGPGEAIEVENMDIPVYVGHPAMVDPAAHLNLAHHYHHHLRRRHFISISRLCGHRRNHNQL